MPLKANLWTRRGKLVKTRFQMRIGPITVFTEKFFNVYFIIKQTKIVSISINID